VIDLFGNGALNHHTRVEGGLLGEDAGGVLRSFFVEKRERYRQRRVGPAPLVASDFASEPIPAGESLEIDDKAPR
jgi:tRNA(adenine34) deaminase